MELIANEADSVPTTVLISVLKLVSVVIECYVFVSLVIALFDSNMHFLSFYTDGRMSFQVAVFFWGGNCFQLKLGCKRRCPGILLIDIKCVKPRGHANFSFFATFFCIS